jgi:cytochrome c-type biogenesis protein CcmE
VSPIVDDDASADEQGDDAGGVALDLSPRGRPDRPVRSDGRVGGRRWPWLVVLAVVVLAVGFVISRAITDATQFYLSADEAVARRTELADRSFRLEGTVVEGSAHPVDAGVDFKVASKGTEVEVHNVSAPPPLFQACIPVVVEGRWDGAVFQSTAIIVAHDEKYEQANSERMKQAIANGAESNACAQRDAVAQR